MKTLFSMCHSLKLFHVAVLLFFFIASCNTLERSQDTALARVGNTYLYRSDLPLLEQPFGNAIDSVLQIQNAIDNWAKEQLLFQQAQINIDVTKHEQLQRQVRQYEAELYGQVYKESVANTLLDTLISQKDIEDIYASNAEIFKLKEPIYQFRYLQLPKSNVDQKEITNRFRRYHANDLVYLDSLSFQFTHYYPGDSIWVNRNVLFEQVEFLNEKNINSYFKKGKFFEVKDSLNVYLFVAKDQRQPNEIAPLNFVEPTLRSIVLNRRKIELLRNFDNELLQDAIRSKNYEVLVE